MTLACGCGHKKKKKKKKGNTWCGDALAESLVKRAGAEELGEMGMLNCLDGRLGVWGV